ncbi:YidC/Oxa1 family insertase periplasmic-domain containing protein [Planctomycetota bacterium]
MDKRFVNFAFASLITLLVFTSLNRILFPPPPPGDEVAAVDGEAEQDGGGPIDVAAEASDDEAAAVLAGSTDAPNDAENTNEDNVADDPNATRSTIASQQRGTMGSLDPASGYNMLVAWNSRGGSIERSELNNPRYTSIDERYGYLGHLMLSERTSGGCTVGIVGAGTPAAIAKSQDGKRTGIRPGDVVISINGEPTDNPLAFQTSLEKTSPGKTAVVVVDRQANGAKSTIAFDVLLTKRPLEVIRPEPEFPSSSNPQHPLSYLLEISQLGNRSLREKETIKGLPSLSKQFWDANVSTDGDKQTVEFTYVLGDDYLKKFGYSGSVEIVKRFTLSPAVNEDRTDGYGLDFDLEFRNKTDSTLDLGYRLQGPTGLPYEGWWYAYKVQPKSWGGAGIRDIIYKFDTTHKMKPNPKIVGHAADNPETPVSTIFSGETKPLEYVGVDGQYFASTLIPTRPGGEIDSETARTDFIYRGFSCLPAGEISKERKNKTDVTYRLNSNPETLPANGSFKQSFTIFAGPKKPEILANYGLEGTISYGWFAPVAKLLTSVLHFFYGIIGNYGIAIVLLTVMVRGCLLPFGRQQAMNAARMQELSPEIKKINEKYKDDLTKKSEAQRALFRQNNYNPLAGCLPMFFQLPIFVGLYRALSVDIELRQAALIPGLQWCSNLAAPDQLFRWDGFMPTFLAGMNGFLGPYFNLLPLFSVGLMIVHQKLFSPPPTDEQQEMQMKMMKYMMIVFGFMFFRVPAGLCLYFITSSLWAVGERKLLPKPKPKKKKVMATDNPVEPRSEVLVSRRNKENSLLTKIQEAVDQKQNPKQSTANGAARKKERDQQRKKKRKK